MSHYETLVRTIRAERHWAAQDWVNTPAMYLAWARLINGGFVSLLGVIWLAL
jgi:hypothetical protein